MQYGPVLIYLLIFLAVTVQCGLVVIYLVGHPTVMVIVDDHAAHQTLAVSINKPISMARTFCKDDLNEFIEVASSALAGRLFHLFTTLSE